jgi:hypothetical protein
VRSGIQNNRESQSGNVLLIILTAIVLIGILTAVIQGTSSSDGANIDREQLLLNTTKIRQYATELETAVTLILRDGHSESDIRFANPENNDYGDLSADTDKSDQVFAAEGGAAEYRSPPAGIQTAAAPWEFYGGTALPGVGTARPELVAVLPGVTQAFCNKINEMNGYDLADADYPPLDTGTATADSSNAGGCIHEGAAVRYDDTIQFYDPPDTPNNTTTESTIEITPALQGCLRCHDGTNHFFHVLLGR